MGEESNTRITNPAVGLRVFFSTEVYVFYLYLFGCARSYLWHVGSSSLTRVQTQVPCIGSSKCQQLDHQGSPHVFCFFPLVFLGLSQRIQKDQDGGAGRSLLPSFPLFSRVLVPRPSAVAQVVAGASGSLKQSGRKTFLSNWRSCGPEWGEPLLICPLLEHSHGKCVSESGKAPGSQKVPGG